MANEIEMKFKVETFSAIRKSLRTAGAKYIGTVMQTDRYFDTSGGELRKIDTAVRLRQVRVIKTAPGVKIDRRPQITYKGPITPHHRAKVRREVQTHIDDASALEEILRTAGLAPTMTIEKRRASYRLGRCMIELDELPAIGRFVEIEADSEKLINAAAKKLSLNGKPIADHYVNLLIAACDGAGTRCTEITFDRWKKCKLAQMAKRP